MTTLRPHLDEFASRLKGEAARLAEERRRLDVEAIRLTVLKQRIDAAESAMAAKQKEALKLEKDLDGMKRQLATADAELKEGRAAVTSAATEVGVRERERREIVLQCGGESNYDKCKDEAARRQYDKALFTANENLSKARQTLQLRRGDVAKLQSERHQLALRLAESRRRLSEAKGALSQQRFAVRADRDVHDEGRRKLVVAEAMWASLTEGHKLDQISMENARKEVEGGVGQ